MRLEASDLQDEWNPIRATVRVDDLGLSVWGFQVDMEEALDVPGPPVPLLPTQEAGGAEVGEIQPAPPVVAREGQVYTDGTPVREPAPDIVGNFQRGYRDFGGSIDWEGHFVSVVAPCESGWRPVVGTWGHLGYLQFDPGTWATVAALTGLWDWQDAYSQGGNTAVWSSMVLPWSSGGWECW